MAVLQTQQSVSGLPAAHFEGSQAKLFEGWSDGVGVSHDHDLGLVGPHVTLSGLSS